MRKRIGKRYLIYKATPTYGVAIRESTRELKPFVRIFGEWKPIKKSELSHYKGFKIEYR